MKRIVKRNNENANLKIRNYFITIDYVLPKAINLATSKKTNSINRICPCFQPQNNYSKTKIQQFYVALFQFP